MPDNELFSAVGIKIPDLVSGFGGGIVNALFFQRTKPMDAIASTIGGAITANYLAGIFVSGIEHLIGQSVDRGVAGFIVGITAMAICQGILASMRGWINRFQPKGGGGGGDV